MTAGVLGRWTVGRLVVVSLKRWHYIKGNQTALAQFMRDHPSLGWIQLIFNGDFERAAKVLYELAQCETEFVARKKSMLSLAKLAAFAAADSDLTAQVEKINADLTLIEYQSQLSHDVLQSFGFDTTEQKVLKAEEIINVRLPKICNSYLY